MVREMIALGTPTITPASTAQTQRPYQVDAGQAVKLAWAKRQKPLVSMATGLGKTTVISQLLVDEIDPEHQRALVIAHTQELIYQPYERISNQFGKALKPFYLVQSAKYAGTVYAPGIGIVMGAQDAPTARIVVATRQSLHPKRLQEVLDAGVIDVVVIDECFPAGTLVDGRPIETIAVGDEITAYNEKTGVFTKAKVTRTFVNTVGDRLVQIRFGGRTILCTPDHPFLTAGGWKAAHALTTHDVLLGEQNVTKIAGNTHYQLPAMREASAIRYTTKATGVQAIRQSLLLQGVFRSKQAWQKYSPSNSREMSPMRQRLYGNERLATQAVNEAWARLLLASVWRCLSGQDQFNNSIKDQSKICFRTHEKEEPHARSCNQAQDEPNFAGVALETSRTRWEWYGLYPASTFIGGGVRVGDGIPDPHGQAQIGGVSGSVQNRCSRTDFEDSHRSGWGVAQDESCTGGGQEENRVPHWVKVDSVEILESRGDREFAGLCPKGLVYNLEVTPYHTYTVQGVVVHNCHHASPGSTYGDIVQALAAANPKLRIAGFTATPKRTDNKALAAVFDEITFHYGIKEAIRDGWLVPVSRIRVKTQVQTENIPTVSGDYHKKRLIAVLDSSNWVELAVQAYKDYIQKAQRPCLAFFPEVAQSRRFAAALMEAGIPAAHIDANTPKQERADILRDYKAGKLLVVSNMGVLTEGFDAAHTSAILMARPTRSATLLTQIIGRGLRLHPGKSDCLIVDLTVSDTKVLEAGSLTGRQRRCQQCSVEFYLGFKACPHCGAVVPSEIKEERDEDEVDLSLGGGYRYSAPKGEGTGLHEEVASLFDSLSAAWHKGAEGWYSCSVGETGAMVIAPPSFHDPERARQRLARGQALLGQFDEADRNELIEQMDMVRRMLIRCDQHTLYFVRKSSNSNNRSLSCEYLRPNGDLISLMAEADVEVLKRAGSEGKALSKRDATWRLQLPSDGQLGYLRSLGWTGPVESKGVAAALITHITSTRRVLSWIEDDTLPEPEEN